VAPPSSAQDNHDKHVRYSVTDLGTLGGTFSTANGPREAKDLAGKMSSA
jgi:hypothetical protein